MNKQREDFNDYVKCHIAARNHILYPTGKDAIQNQIQYQEAIKTFKDMLLQAVKENK